MNAFGRTSLRPNVTTWLNPYFCFYFNILYTRKSCMIHVIIVLSPFSRCSVDVLPINERSSDSLKYCIDFNTNVIQS